jgi:hypothetical protein
MDIVSEILNQLIEVNSQEDELKRKKEMLKKDLIEACLKDRELAFLCLTPNINKIRQMQRAKV